MAVTWNDFDAAAFYEQLARKYPEAEVVYSTLEGKLRRDFVRSFLRSQTGTLLDVGCNVGIHLERYKGRKIGVDIAPSLVAEARKRVPDGIFHVGSAESMDFLPDKSVDVVLCTEVLEHLERPEAALGEFARVMKEEGRMLVTTPNRLGSDHEDWIESEILKDFGIEQRYFHTAFTPRELADKVAAAGLDIEQYGSFAREVTYCHAMAYPLYSFAWRVNRRLFRSSVLEPGMRRAYFLLERSICSVATLSGLRRYLNARVPEGKFSFVIGRKASDKQLPQRTEPSLTANSH
jgi:ubiquinone/menaquinone biosynthesis C-methylase UbiE